MRKLSLILAVSVLCSLLVVPAYAASGADLLAGADMHVTFEDGIVDEKGNYTFTADGDVPSVDGRFGKGVSTDSADHYFYSDDLKVGADSWTLTAWINVADHASDMALISNKDWNSGGNPGFVISQKDDCWRFNGNPGSRFDYNPSFREAHLDPDRGVWYHLAVVVDRAAAEIRWYVNGYICGDPFPIDANGDGDLDSDLPFTFGQDGTGFYGDGFVNATFDELAFFKRALTTDEVVAVYTYAPDGFEPAVLEERVEKVDGPSANPAPAVAEFNGIVPDGLVIYYDGANNQGVGQDKEATVWRDVSGNGYDFEVSLEGNNKWTDKSYYIDSTSNYFQKKVTEIANGDNYTIELALGEIEQPGTNWISFIISDNDEFSLFRRVENDVLEYKYNDANSDRPIAEDGEDLFNNSTVAVTFNLENMDCIVYVDGEEVANGIPTVSNVANDMHLGSDSPQRNWLGDVYAIRFYDRDLTPDEIARNAAADNERYRSGKAIENPVFETAEETPAAEAPAAEEPAAEEAAAPAVEKAISMSKTEFKVGEDVLVTASGEGTDWVGLYKEGDTPGGPASTAWYYVTEHNGEEYAITNSLPAGNYTMGLYLNDGYDLFGEAIPFTVVADEAPAEEAPAAESKGFADVNAAADGKGIITAYTFTEGSNGFGGEGAENLFDGDIATKFCTNEFPVEAVAELDGIYKVTGFTMATANDNADWNGRSPSAWTISVSADGENWTELASGDASFFEETNFTYYVGDASAEGVSYVKLNAEGTESGIFQVSELTLFGEKTAEAVETPEAVDEALDDKAEAPQTFDFGVIAAVTAVVSLAGFAASKKRH